MKSTQFIYSAVKYLDIGGVEARFYVSEKYKTHKTFTGGVISLFLYSISLSYGSYVMYQWMKGELISRVQTITTADDFSNFQLLSDKVSLRLYPTNPQYQDIDPFSTVNNIIMPIYLIVNTSEITGPFPLLLNQDRRGPNWHSPGVLPDIQLVQSIERENYDINSGLQIIYMLTKCDEKNKMGYKCANESFINQYMSNGINLLSLAIKSQQIQNGQIKDLLKEYFFTLQWHSRILSQVILRTKNLSIDTGMLFPSIKSFNLIDSSEVVSSSIDKQFTIQKFGLDAYFTTSIRLDSLQTIQQEVAPKLGEVFANIFSILQVLFMIRYLILYMNGKDFDNIFVNDTIHAMAHGVDKNLSLQESKELYEFQKCETLRNSVLKKLNIFNVYHQLIKLEAYYIYLMENSFKSFTSQNVEIVKPKLDLENSQNQEAFLINSTKPSAKVQKQFDNVGQLERQRFRYDDVHVDRLLNRIDAFL